MMPRRIIVWRFVFVAHSSRASSVVACPDFCDSLPSVVLVSKSVPAAVCLRFFCLCRRVVLKAACVGVRTLSMLGNFCDEHILAFVIGVRECCAPAVSYGLYVAIAVGYEFFNMRKEKASYTNSADIEELQHIQQHNLIF